MPNVQLDDLVFPKAVKVEEEQEKTTVKMPFDIIDIFNSINENGLHADVTTNVKTSGTLKSPNLKGVIDVNALTVAVNGKNYQKVMQTSNSKEIRQTLIQFYLPQMMKTKKLKLLVIFILEKIQLSI